MNGMYRVNILYGTNIHPAEIQNKVDCNSRHILEIHNNYVFGPLY